VKQRLRVVLLLSFLPFARTCLLSAGEIPPPAPGAAVERSDFGRVTWGRNSVRLRLRNEGDNAVSLAVRIRSFFQDSGSGIVWEASYPVLVPRASTGEIALDYFVRPDHGLLRVELGAEDGKGGWIHQEVKEVLFEAPYRGNYVLQPYRLAREGVAWEGRILPPFRVRESEHFIFYYFPSSEAEKDMEKIITRRERIFQRLSREMDVRFPGKAVYFFYPDSALARKVTGHRGDGWTYGRTMVEVYGARRKIDPYHELVHLLARRIGSPPVLFSEGFATSREKEFDNAGRYRAEVEAWCRGFLREGALLPLVELMENTSLGDDLTRPRVAYPQSACFVRYLLEEHGWPKFREAYAEMVSSDDPGVQKENLDRFERIYGVSLREAEVVWKQSLSRARGGSVPAEMVRRVVREETVPYLVARGRGLIASGAVEEAEKILRSAVEKDPGSVDALFWLGQALHLRKDYAGALGAYGKVVQLGNRAHLTQVAWSRVWSGQILDILGRRPEALEEYRKAEALQDEGQVQVGGRLTTSREAAREGISRPYQPLSP